jgi:hypothetical protein
MLKKMLINQNNLKNLKRQLYVFKKEGDTVKILAATSMINSNSNIYINDKEYSLQPISDLWLYYDTGHVYFEVEDTYLINKTKIDNTIPTKERGKYF